MKDFDLLKIEQWQPLAWLGLDSKLFTFNFETVIYTWIIMAMLFLLIIPIRYLLTRKKNIARHAFLSFISFFVSLVEQTVGHFAFHHFAFVTTLFTFIAVCNTASLIPWMDEPTKDINTTLALGIISFVYTQACALKTQGIKDYIKEYFSPFFIMFPLNVIGRLAMIISISFRLFGNIFGGSIIGGIYTSAIQGSLIYETIGLVSGLNLLLALFFGLFEGLLQAFVFAILSLTYIAIALQQEEPQ